MAKNHPGKKYPDGLKNQENNSKTILIDVKMKYNNLLKAVA